jgi:hypothetical protein
MARFITVHVRCDWAECPVIAEEGTDEVVEKTVALDKAQPKAFLLCKEHLVHFEEILLPLLQAGIKVENVSGKKQRSTAGAAAGAAPSAVTSPVDPGNGHKNETFECRVPDCGRTINRRTGLAQHVIRTHNFESVAAYEAMYPDSTID